MNENVDPARVETVHHPSPATQKPQPPKTRRLARWLFVLAIAVAAVLAWQHFENIAPSPDATPNGGRASGPPPQTIRDAMATKGDIPIYVNALGTVTSLATVTVRAQIAGNLQEVGFEEGQIVKAGDFLAQIDPRPYQAALAQAQAQLAKDTALHAQAQANLARFVTLGKQDSIAAQQLDDQKFLVAQDQAAMASDQAQVDAAALNLSYCRIVAPVSGRIGLRQVDVGNYVQISDANGIVVITQLEPISVIFSTPEDNLPQIAARMKAGATLPATVFDRANVKELATGELTTIDNQIDTTTGTFKARASFANKDGALFPNQFVNVRLLVDTLSAVVVAPTAAVQLGPNGNFAYVVKSDDTVSMRPVKIGPAESGRTAILSGLEDGENVVIDGADRLRDGAKVMVRNGSAAAGERGSNAQNNKSVEPGAKPDSEASQPDQAGQQQRKRRRQGGDAGAAPAASPAQ